MTRKLAELDDMEMGDLSSVIGRSPVVDLSWLAVDEEEYRKNSAIPHQNLDMIPELSKAMEDGLDGVPVRLPYRDINLTNVNPLEHKLETYQDVQKMTRRAAEYVYKDVTDRDILGKLSAEFGPASVQRNSNKIATILSERGLLGNVYVEADHFTKCVDSKSSIDFVKRYAKKSLLVVQSDKCDGCVKNHQGRCASFGKFLTASVNYDKSLLSHYIPELAESGRLASNGLQDVKSILRHNFRSELVVKNEESVNRLWTQQKVAKKEVTTGDIEAFLKSAAKPVNDVSLEFLAASKKLMLGKTSSIYLSQHEDVEVRKLASLEGLWGTYIVDMDALGGCARTSSYLKERGINRGLYLIRRSASCSMCHCSKGGPCDKLSRSFRIVSSIPEITVEDYETVALDKVASGLLTRNEAVEAIRRFADANSDVRVSAFRRTASLSQPLTDRRDYGQAKAVAFTGNDSAPKPVDVQEMNSFISSKMNEGIYGKDLDSLINNRYASYQIKQFEKAYPDVASMDGIQGSYYLDPTAYSDYAKGCKTGSFKFRGRGAPNLKISSGCVDCTKRTSPGWCSAYSKPLVASVDLKVASAFSKKVHLPIVSTKIEADPADKFELYSEMSVDLGKPRRTWEPKI